MSYATRASPEDELQEGVVVFAVAQQWFETSTETGAVNTFSTLQPLALEDGARARDEDFPNNGLVWWKLQATAKKAAAPGRLFAGYIEPAIVYAPHDHTKQYYQAISHQIEPVQPGDAIEIFTISDTAIRAPRELVNTPGLLEIDHPPSDLVIVRWRGELYGPLRTSIAASGEGLYRVTLAAEMSDGTTYCMPDIPAGAVGHLRLHDVRISLDAQPPYRSHNTRAVSYELALPQALAAIDTSTRVKIVLLRDDELILRTARRLLTRGERQQLSELLETLRTAAQERSDDDIASLGDVIDAVHRRLTSGSSAVPALADALLRHELMAVPLEQAVQRHAEQHIEQSADALQAQIEERIAEARAQLDALQTEREDLASALQARRRGAERELRDAIDAAWQEHRARVQADLERVETERAKLEEQGRDLSERLTRIASSFGVEHERLLGDLLVLMPVLQRANDQLAAGDAADRASAGTGGGTDTGGSGGAGMGGSGARMGGTSGAGLGGAAADEAPFVLPAYVARGAVDPRGAPDEAVFFERFTEHARAAGYEYDDTELAAFHIAMKCGAVTLVTGPSGSGRTGLSRLYTEALAGDAGDVGDERRLDVPVQATWVDVQDLIGVVNPHTRTFEPAANGVFAFLVAAAEEHAAHGGDSGVHMLCLDGINRAPAELYLSVLLHALDQPADRRLLRCFDAHAVRRATALARWGTLLLAPSLRIVGSTVDDETGRPLTSALRDRATEVRLAGVARHRLVPDALNDAAPRRVNGASVPARALQRWARDAAPPEPWAGLLDALHEPLRAHGLGLSPRALRMMHRFIASAGGLLPTDAAVDMQLAQRVLPRFAAAGFEQPTLLDEVGALLAPHLDVLPATARALQLAREETL